MIHIHSYTQEPHGQGCFHSFYHFLTYSLSLSFTHFSLSLCVEAFLFQVWFEFLRISFVLVVSAAPSQTGTHPSEGTVLLPRSSGIGTRNRTQKPLFRLTAVGRSH